MHKNDFIQQLPKAEVHLHLEGAVPWEVVRGLSSETLPDVPEWWADAYRFPDWTTFGNAFFIVQEALSTVETYQLAASAIFENLAAQNVRYVEISIGSEAVLRKGLRIDDVALAVKNATPDGMKIAFFCGFNRGFSYPLDDEIVQAVLNAPIDGIDLHGPETEESAIPYAQIFEAARHRGLMAKAHAGEFQGPQSIYDALDTLMVKRI
jgi:adenosine deaminase